MNSINNNNNTIITISDDSDKVISASNEIITISSGSDCSKNLITGDEFNNVIVISDADDTSENYTERSEIILISDSSECKSESANCSDNNILFDFEKASGELGDIDETVSYDSILLDSKSPTAKWLPRTSTPFPHRIVFDASAESEKCE